MNTGALGTYSAVYTLDLTDAVSDGISGDVEAPDVACAG